jgi:hypothetical protein
MDPMATNPGDRKEKIAQATYRFTVKKTNREILVSSSI